MLKRYLVKNGFLVTEAQDAQDARAKLKSLEFDLLILDVMMPGETGFRTADPSAQGHPGARS